MSLWLCPMREDDVSAVATALQLPDAVCGALRFDSAQVMLMGLDQGFIRAAGGILCSEHIGYCWIVIHPDLLEVRRKRVWLARQIRAVLDDATLKHGYRSLEAHAAIDHADAIALLDWCGFRLVGRRRRYFSDGGDALLFDWIEEETCP